MTCFFSIAIPSTIHLLLQTVTEDVEKLMFLLKALNDHFQKWVKEDVIELNSNHQNQNMINKT